MRRHDWKAAGGATLGALVFSADPDPAQERPYQAGSTASAACCAAAASPDAHSAATACTAPTASASAYRAASAAPRYTPAEAARCTASRCAASAASAAAAAACRDLQGFAGLKVVLVEDIECRQAYVGDFLLAEKDDRMRSRVLRRGIRRRSCRCAARHCQRDTSRSHDR